MSKTSHDPTRNSVETKLRSLSMAGPDPDLRRQVLEAGRRRLAERADLLHVEPTLQPWSLESLLAAAVLVLILTVPRLLAPQVPTETSVPSAQRSQLKQQLGNESLGHIGSRVATPRATEGHRALRADPSPQLTLDV